MDIDNIKKSLARFELFNELGHEQIELLTKYSQILNLSQDSYVFNRGDSAQGLYLLIAGQIKLGIASTQGIEKIISIISPGNSFGESGLFLEQQLPFYAKAIINSEVLLVSGHTIRLLLDSDANLARKMQERLSDCLHQMIHDIETLSFQNAIQRFIGYLLQISANAVNAEIITLPIRKGAIASMLNTTPETLSRSISKLQHIGLIDVKGNRIIITDVVKLRKFTIDH